MSLLRENLLLKLFSLVLAVALYVYVRGEERRRAKPEAPRSAAAATIAPAVER